MTSGPPSRLGIEGENRDGGIRCQAKGKIPDKERRKTKQKKETVLGQVSAEKARSADYSQSKLAKGSEVARVRTERKGKGGRREREERKRKKRSWRRSIYTAGK